MKDLETISTDLFNKIRSKFSDIKIGNAEGALTTDPKNARFFDVNYKVEDTELGRVNIKIDEKALTIIYSESMTEGQADSVKDKWFAFLRDMRQFARKNLLKFDTRDITKSNLEKRDYKYLAQESGESKMSESKLFGTSKTSYQDMGEARLIVKHSQPVNYNVPAGRTQHIESIYIESANGERFRYPHKHLNGARAMARHIANGGTAYDGVGAYISGLSEELSKLRQFKNYTQRSGVMAEALSDVSAKVLERIDSIKDEIASLQKQNYYESFIEGFQPGEAVEVPEDTVNTWVDALTIKTFNEELKSVFPYIYRLVSEKTQEGLTYEDIVSEEDECEDCGNNPCTCEDEMKENSMFQEFEDQLEAVASFDYDFPEMEDSDMAVEEADSLESKVAELLKRFDSDMNEVGGYGDPDMREIIQHLKNGDAESAAEVVWYAYTDQDGGEFPEKEPYVDDLQAEFEDLVQHSEGVESSPAAAVPKEVVEFIASMYDRNTGTFPRGEEGVKIAVEKKFGEQAGRFANFVVEKLSAKNQPIEEPAQDPAVNEIERIRSLAGM
jgi:hypothetical protein